MANPESGFSLNFKMNDPQGVENQFTLRTESNELPDVSALLEDRDTLVEQLLNNGWTSVVYGRKDTGGSGSTADSGQRQTGYGSSRGGSYSGNRGGNQQASAGNTENCRCGVPGVRKSGTSAKGPWSGIMCRNRNCDPIFDRNN